ncbi:TPA: hypothetical protein N0F65_005906 [Lagenidium giganteum]|uniref:histidinol-phosphate transaminase n=1 Tax=Lagenidium giganteum TaxID=4803 RepID=A0AAV2ZBY7_9STRA|nr:TPA: hypothetical protein N0F65_005906 [Lagenidium giganteum]
MLDRASISTVALSVGVGLSVGYAISQKQLQAASKLCSKGNAAAAAEASSDEVERLIRPNILRLAPYRCARDDYDQGILLDANENSLGPPLPATHPELPEHLERYPCPYQRGLKQELADFRNGSEHRGVVKPENIFLGVGSDEAIDLLIRVACTPRVDSILITPPTYGMYEVCANIHDVDIIRVPLKVTRPESNLNGLKSGEPMPSFHIDPQEILRAVTPQTKLVFLCSPGNPTANSLRVEDIEVILNDSSYKGFVVVDEAYIDFTSTPSMCTLVNKHKRLVVLQTLSKGFGLAGIRLGSAFGNPRLVQILNNVKAPYNINKLTAKVALEAIRNKDLLSEKVQLICKERSRVMDELRRKPFVRCIYASDSNFVLFQVPHALEIYKTMADRGVVIRYRGSQLNLKDCLRATIGSPEENDRMLELLTEIAGELNA